VKAWTDDVIIVTADNTYPLDIGVSTYGGVIAPDGWRLKLPDKGTQIDSYTIFD
jgi:hypothetical protein